jgi:LmbE family N-acetylglucosaminyl deacetylase
MAHDLGRTVLVVAAHPDDEVLGCGGTLARLARAGTAVHVGFLADGVASRAGTAAQTAGERRAAAARAAQILGVQSVAHHGFPDNACDTVPLIEITKVVEQWIARLQPDTVLTHHAGDVNVDHRRAHEAVITACRPQPGRCVTRILCFEVPSSTEWQPPGSGVAFAPSLFVDIAAELAMKRRALEAYDVEMRPWPHSRSYEAVEHLARWRGATVGCEAAEAFMIARQILRAAPPPA